MLGAPVVSSGEQNFRKISRAQFQDALFSLVAGLNLTQIQQIRFFSDWLLTDRQGPAPLVTVATSDTIPGTVKPKATASTGTSAIAVSVSDDFWSNTSTISSRSRQKGLQYAVEGCIQNIKINNEVDTTIIEANAYRSQ